MVSPRPVLVLALLCLVVPVLAGCFGDVRAVYIPDSALPSDWTHEAENETESVAAGRLEIITNQYGGSSSTTTAGIYLIGATDVPVVNEADVMHDQIREFAASDGVTLTKTGTTTKVLDNGVTVDVASYDIQRKEAWGSADGKAWIVTGDTGDFFVGGIGFATTEYKAAGLISTQTRNDDQQWRQVQDMMLAMDW